MGEGPGQNGGSVGLPCGCLRSGRLIADQFADSEHEFVDALVRFARALRVLASHLIDAFRDRRELRRHLIEPAPCLGRKLSDRLLDRKLTLGEEANHLFESIQSLSIRFGRRDFLLSHTHYLSRNGEQPLTDRTPLSRLVTPGTLPKACGMLFLRKRAR